MLTVLGILMFALLGGFVSRMCGGMPPKLPWGLDQHIYAAPYAFVVWPVSWIASVASYVGAFLGKRTGHGNGIDAGHVPHPSDDEKLEFLIKWLHGRIPEYWYDILLLSITGFAVTLVAGVCLLFVNPLAGTVIALSGLTKGFAYMVGWFVYPNGSSKNAYKELNEATEIGEFLTGFFGYGILAITYVTLLL